MSKGKLQAALDDFVQTIVGIAEDTAQETLASRAKALRTVKHSGRKPMTSQVATKKKKKTMTKPCPAPDCGNMGAPRYGMMCSEHKDFSKEEKNALRFAAKQPGGAWSDKPSPAKAVKRTRKGSTRKPAKKASRKTSSVADKKAG